MGESARAVWLSEMPAAFNPPPVLVRLSCGFFGIPLTA